MVGNKHKNGIICTFPGCDKTMRTQKFKIHFTKAHLKQGEVYTVEHRRRFEVAREDGGSTGGGGGGGGGTDSPSGGTGSGGGAVELPVELVASEERIKHDPTISTHPGALQPHQPPQPPPAPVAVAVNSVPEPARRQDDGQHPLAELAAQTVSHGTDLLQEARDAADMAWAMAKQPSAPAAVTAAVTYEPAQAPRTPETSNPLKRPAAVLEEPTPAEEATAPPAAATSAADSTDNTLLVEFVALMDRRFQELVGKVGEMIDVQKELIDALKGGDPSALSHQAPALALASAAEVVMKKRKRENPASNGGTVV